MPCPRRFALLLPLACVALAACAATRPVAMRLQLQTVQDWPQLAELTERVRQITDMPVTDAAAAGPRQVALTLQCPDRSSCKRAAMKLAARHDLIAELRPEQTRRLPGRPTPEMSR